MNKTDVVKILNENYQEAHQLLWSKKKDEVLVLPKKIYAICSPSEGYITKVRMECEDGQIECYFEDNDDIDSGWTDISTLSYGYENNIYLAIDEVLNKPIDEGTEKALDALLKLYGEESAKDEIMNAIKTGDVWVRQDRKTRYKFWWLGKYLGHICVSNVYYVELDLKNYERLHKHIQTNHKARYDMFEFEKDENCIVAMD
jgi:hypothetical protein